MTGKKGARGEAAAPLWLELVDRQDGARAAGHTEPIGASVDDRTGS
jgi:hypothetical protein